MYSKPSPEFGLIYQKIDNVIKDKVKLTLENRVRRDGRAQPTATRR